MAGTNEIKFWIMSWGSHALVLEPESLQEEIRTEVEKTTANYYKMITERQEVFASDRKGS